ncbi:MAG: YceI family protein [Sphingobacteriales bacterium]|jgi:polyisoprenoid-binding protein YceI|nr:YceI family protein [Sphingobacteriales bacterium]
MNRKLVLFLAVIFSSYVGFAQLYSTSTAKVSFFSKTPIEDINAETNTGLMVVNTQTQAIAFSITNTSFEFPNKLMQEHFNEKYMESEKFPKSTFAGKLSEPIDWTKDAEHTVNVVGKLNVHGVEKERTIQGVIKIVNGVPHITSTFKVKNVDHNIQIPTIVVSKIAEEIEVKVAATLAPKK